MIGVLNVGYAKAYLPILRTLWAYSQEEDVVGTMSVNRSPITDPENSEWYQEKKRTFILSKDTSPHQVQMEIMTTFQRRLGIWPNPSQMIGTTDSRVKEMKI